MTPKIAHREIAASVRPLLDAISRIPTLASDTDIDPERVRNQFREQIEAWGEDATDSKIPRAEVETMSFALVALADEIALAKPGLLRDHWLKHLLQFEFFGENTAGATFFEKLESLRGDREREDTLYVYFLCLLFGFRGKLAMRGSEAELANLIDELREQLVPPADEAIALAPHGLRSARSGKTKRGFFARLSWVTVSGVLLAISIAAYVILRLDLERELHEFEDEAERQITQIHVEGGHAS